MDEIYPRMAEPDEEGIDLHPADPRRRFIATCEGVTFSEASPLTEEDLAELARMKKMLGIDKQAPRSTKNSSKNAYPELKSIFITEATYSVSLISYFDLISSNLMTFL